MSEDITSEKTGQAAEGTTYVRRGVWLSWLLGLRIVGGLVVAVLYVIYGPRFGKANMPPAWTPYIMAMISLLVSIFALAAWNWKKAGIIGLIVLALINMGMGYYLDIRTEMLVGSGLGLALLIFFVWPVWKYFR